MGRSQPHQFAIEIDQRHCSDLQPLIPCTKASSTWGFPMWCRRRGGSKARSVQRGVARALCRSSSSKAFWECVRSTCRATAGPTLGHKGHKAPWPNGEGIGLRSRGLQVRVLPGSFAWCGMPCGDLFCMRARLRFALHCWLCWGGRAPPTWSRSDPAGHSATPAAKLEAARRPRCCMEAALRKITY